MLLMAKNLSKRLPNAVTTGLTDAADVSERLSKLDKLMLLTAKNVSEI
jgi:hypothetical protein